MKALFSKAELEAEIVGRFGKSLTLQEKNDATNISTGIQVLDDLIGGIPRGSLSEIFGTISSGRTSLLFSMLGYATTHDEICALVDTHNVFAPSTAAAAGIDLDRLLWVRCGANIENAFKAADLLLHAGGFGLVVLDMADVAGKDAKRIISSWWYRFRRTVENKPSAIVVMASDSCVRSCAALSLELKGLPEWTCKNDRDVAKGEIYVLHERKSSRLATLNAPVDSRLVTHSNLLQTNSIRAFRRRPITPGLNDVHFKAKNKTASFL
jgi:recA bacterial DNA recombination protein